MKRAFFAALVIFLVALLALPSVGNAKGKSKYMVVTTHTPEQCMQVMDDVVKQNPKILDKCWFGCTSGNHTAYALVDATSEEDALNMVPPALRANAKVSKVEKLTPTQIKAAHKQM